MKPIEILGCPSEPIIVNLGEKASFHIAQRLTAVDTTALNRVPTVTQVPESDIFRWRGNGLRQNVKVTAKARNTNGGEDVDTCEYVIIVNGACVVFHLVKKPFCRLGLLKQTLNLMDEIKSTSKAW